MKPPYTVNNKILNLVADISQIVGNLEIQVKRNLRLRKVNRIKSIYSSLAIENNSLTLEQVTAIVNGKRVLGNPKEIDEVKNAYEVYERILSLNPYDKNDFLYAHSMLMKNLVSEAGRFRSKDVGIYDTSGKVIHMGARPPYINDLIDELFLWGKTEELHEIIKSCIVHYEIENIHPFEDGNGRMGRLWQTIILSSWNSLFAWIPVETIIYEHQEEYYQMLRRADMNNDSTVFIEFMLEIILITLNDYKLSSDYEELNKEEEKVYLIVSEYLRIHKYITTTEASKLTNKSSPTIRRYFTKFIELELLKSVGENKNRKYCLNNI